jgi:hypothetical protein
MFVAAAQKAQVVEKNMHNLPMNLLADPHNLQFQNRLLHEDCENVKFWGHTHCFCSGLRSFSANKINTCTFRIINCSIGYCLLS